jgi:two-component system invasion response regulator UvrY
LIRIIIVDDHQLVREGIKKIIGHTEGMCVVGEATNILEAIELVAERSPDIIILDINLPGYHGIEALTEVRQRFPLIAILVLSMYSEEQSGVQALKAGADGYISKITAAEEVANAIQKILSEGSYISGPLAKMLAWELRGARVKSPLERLTDRELQVIRMLGEGMQIKQIAAALSISISSVNTYRARIFEKLGLSSNAALIRYAIEHHLVKQRG